jgi:hypothetical protein
MCCFQQLPFKKCLNSLAFGEIQNLIILCTERSLSETGVPFICYIMGGTLIVLQNVLLFQKGQNEKN